MKEDNVLLDKSYAFAVRTVKLFLYLKKNMAMYRFLTNSLRQEHLLVQTQKKPLEGNRDLILFQNVVFHTKKLVKVIIGFDYIEIQNY